LCPPNTPIPLARGTRELLWPAPARLALGPARAMLGREPRDGPAIASRGWSTAGASFGGGGRIAAK